MSCPFGPAVADKTLFNGTIRFFRFLLVDVEGTMFSDTSLPANPIFADQSDFQQTSIDLVAANGERTQLDPVRPREPVNGNPRTL